MEIFNQAPPSNPVIKYIVNNGQYLDEISGEYEQLGLIEHDNIEFECLTKYKGYPAPNFAWLKNGLAFSNQSRIFLKNLTSYNHLSNFTCIVYSDALAEPIKKNIRLFLYCK